MNAIELWNEYLRTNPITDCEYTAWAFGCDADLLAKLVVEGKKTATASAYDLYESAAEPLPKEGSYNVILDSKEEAVCIIQTTKVYVVPFCEVSASHAYKEGEGDQSLEFWRKVHRPFFSMDLMAIGIPIDENRKVVCEEFKLVYPPATTNEISNPINLNQGINI